MALNWGGESESEERIEEIFWRRETIYLKFVSLFVSHYCVNNIYHVFTSQPTVSEVIRT